MSGADEQRPGQKPGQLSATDSRLADKVPMTGPGGAAAPGGRVKIAGKEQAGSATREVAALAPRAEIKTLAKPGNRQIAQPVPHGPQIAPAAWAVEALRIDIAAEMHKRRRGFLRRMMIFIVVPTLLSAGYVFWYATPRYVSEFQITYQTIGAAGASGSSGSMISGLVSSLFGGGSSGAVDYSRVLWSYLTSDAALRKVDKELNLRAHYGSSRIDWLDRLSAGASEEKFLDYFQRRIDVNDMMGGYLVVDIEGFDPKFTAKIATAMRNASDEMFNKLTLGARQEEVAVADKELKRTQGNLVKATVALTEFRNQHRDFNPTTMATQLDTVVGSLELQLSQARAELTRDRIILRENSPQIFALKTQIAALERQIEGEKRRLATADGAVESSDEALLPASHALPSVGQKLSSDAELPSANGRSQPYSKIVEIYTALELDVQFATNSYLAAKQANDLARMQAASQQNFVETFVEPNLPQESTSPDPWIYIPSTFLVSLALYAVGSLVAGAFRDQAGI